MTYKQILYYKNHLISITTRNPQQEKLMAQVSLFLPIFIAIVISYIYVIASAFFVHRKCNYIHETAVSILLGVIIGVIVVLWTELFETNSYQPYLRIIIILILLPPMLYEDGYNIRKRKFFQNILYINLYGILGTVINFFVIYWILYAFNTYGLLKTLNNDPLNLQTWQLMAISACLCSIDTIVAQKIVNPERYPKLFSVIFGQSIIKDAITITLFDAIVNYSTKMSDSKGGADPQFNASEFLFLSLTFFEVFAGSILIGIACGLVNTFLFKNFRFLLDQKGVAEVAMIILIGYSSYILSEWAAYSGVISMLFCGITLSHFNIYNLTPEGKISAKVAVSALAKVSEGLLFFILGGFIFGIQIERSSDQEQKYTFSWTLLLATMLAIIVARFANVYLVTLVSYIVVGHKKWRLNHYQYQILFFSGLVKGAIPFAIITTLPDINYGFQTGCIQNTVIIIVFLTSLFVNSFLPKILRNRVAKIDQMIKNNQDHPSLYDSLLIEFRKKEVQQQRVIRQTNLQSNNQSRKPSQFNSDFQHKKQELQKLALYARLKSTTQKYWKRCQQGFLKPFLIHDYHNRRHQIKQEKMRQRKEEVQQFWKRFRLNEGALNTENEQFNKFIDVKLVQSDQYSEDQIQKQKIEQENGELVFYTKNNKSKSKLEKKSQGYELKNITSKSFSVDPVVQNQGQEEEINEMRRQHKSLRMDENIEVKIQKKMKTQNLPKNQDVQIIYQGENQEKKIYQLHQDQIKSI